MGLIERWRDRLPLPKGAKAITIGEGNTPLIELVNLPKDLGFKGRIYVKFEGLNPTGSFKDRGMTVAVTEAVHRGAKAVICASTGNTSASAAAYAMRAGVKAFVLIPEGKIAAGKLAQAIMHGAVVVQIKGNFDDGMRLVKEVAESTPVAIVNSINPYRLQGQKTAAFEIVETLGRAPDVHCLPVGNAGNISAYWLGYCEAAGEQTAIRMDVPDYARVTMTKGRPRMAGYQAAGAAPFLRGKPVAHPETVATAIRIGNPQSWDFALAAQKESNGWFDEFSDEEILAAQKLLAVREGVFCEPASASSVAGAMRDIRSGKIASDALVVCTLTGHGLKDPDIAMRDGLSGVVQVEATREAVARVLSSR